MPGPPPAAQPAQPPASQPAAAQPPERARFTSRAAVLAVVLCAIALSLAYPVREYIAQRQQIDQLLAQQQTLSAQVQALQQQNTKLGQTWYIEQRARAELHMCFPSEQCYEVISGQPPHSAASRKQPPGEPWYDKLWQSVKRADAQPAGAKRPGR